MKKVVSCILPVVSLLLVWLAWCGLVVFGVWILGASDSALAQDRIPCKPGEVLSPDGRCLMPACPSDQVYDVEGGYCYVPIRECQPGRPCTVEQQEVSSKPGEICPPGSRCPFHITLPNMNCKPVRLQIEPACLKAEGCVPEPGVAASLLFTMLVKCS